MCGAKERTNVGAELGTDDLVGAELGEVRNSEFRTYIALPRGSAILVRFLGLGLSELGLRQPRHP